MEDGLKIEIANNWNGEICVHIEYVHSKGISLEDVAAILEKLGAELTTGHRLDLEKDGWTQVSVYL